MLIVCFLLIIQLLKCHFPGQPLQNYKEIDSRKVTSRGRNVYVRECLIYYSDTNIKVNAVLNCVGDIGD